MSRKFNDLTGQTFGELTVLGVGERGSFGKHIRWTCVCTCGNLNLVRSHHLTSGSVKSCGKFKKKGKHVQKEINLNLNHTHNPIVYTKISWTGMVNRCYNPKVYAYPWCGKLGVIVSERWLKFENFLEDMGIRPKDMSIDRIDPFGNYELDNCRWADKFVQANNKRYVKMVQVGNKLVHPLIARGLVKAL